MTANQKTEFWVMVLVFTVVGGLGIYTQGAFNFTGAYIGAGILTFFYLLVVYIIYRFVRGNPKLFD